MLIVAALALATLLSLTGKARLVLGFTVAALAAHYALAQDLFDPVLAELEVVRSTIRQVRSLPDLAP